MHLRAAPQTSAEAATQALQLRARATDPAIRTTPALITAATLRHTKEVLLHRATIDLQAAPASAEDHQAMPSDRQAAAVEA